MSLPGLLGTRLETIPCEIPYLHARGKAALSPPWVKPSAAFKVGLVWSGSSENLTGRYRSLRLESLAPLLQMPELEWYSLQYGGAADELKAVEFSGRIENLGARFRSFDDTAEAISELDLIISVDTAVAHLAGALGKRVWTLLSSEPDWRWMWQREDSPWYPTMRLFRQTDPRDWESVVRQVKEALGNLAPAAGGIVPVAAKGK
jgi:ADP-heptose:LPS heptosyltransferase